MDAGAEPGLARAVRTITAHLPATGTHPPAGSARDATYLHSNDSPSARDTTIDTPGWADQINDAELDVSGTADLTVVPARSAE
jgi:hypothetical protein